MPSKSTLSQSTKEATDVNLEYDIDEFLDNDESLHFRNVHHWCTKEWLPGGSILEANCGQLYRSKGVIRLIAFEKECLSCLSLSGTKPCPVCGEKFDKEPYS